SVDIGMEEAGGGVVERPHKKHLGAIEVNNGIRAYDVEREGAVELDPWVNLIGGDTHVRQEQCRTDVDALGLRVYGLDRVGFVERVIDESVGGTKDLVGVVATELLVIGRLEYLTFCSLLLHNQHQLLVLLLRFREKLSPKSENLAVASADNIHAKPKSKPIDRQVKVFFAVPETVVAKIELPDGVVLQGIFNLLIYSHSTNQEALELLLELAGTEPRFLRRQLVDVVGAMLQIAEAESLEEGTRHLAIEFVITLAEARERAPGMMRKLPQFISRMFAILMKMLLDIEDDPAWHSAETGDEDAGETSNYSVGQECLDRLSISLGGNTIVPVASEQLHAYLAAPEWQKRHAALIALAQIAEGCSKVMIKNLDQVVAMVLNSFNDQHPRVRWAAINAIGQLSIDLGPDLQIQYHQGVLPAAQH
ncbi:hypothetical protein HN51_040986, partial [Arachis hypogaea]